MEDMEGNELTQLSVLKALTFKRQSKDNGSKPYVTSVQSQEKTEPTAKSATVAIGRGRGRPRVSPSVNRSPVDLESLKTPDLQFMQQQGSWCRNSLQSVHSPDNASANANKPEPPSMNRSVDFKSLKTFDLQFLQQPGIEFRNSLQRLKNSDAYANEPKQQFAQQQREFGKITSSMSRAAITAKDDLYKSKIQTRGRARGFQKMLPNVNRSDGAAQTMNAVLKESESFQKQEIEGFSKFVNSPINSPPTPSKIVVCNAVPVTSSYAFEYTVCFKPNINSEVSRCNYLNKHFLGIGTKFLYIGFSVFVARELQNDELKRSLASRYTTELVTMTLNFKEKLNLVTHPKLFQVLFDQVINSTQKSIYVEETKLNIIPNYVIAVRDTKNGIMLCLDRQYYLVQAKTLSKIMLEFKERYRTKFYEGAVAGLTKVPVYYKRDQKIYKIVNIQQENLLLELEKNGHHTMVNPDDCNLVEIVNNISSYTSQTPKDFMSDIQELFSSELLKNNWNLHLGIFVKAVARVLKPETIIFGDGVKCTPKNGNWETKLRENEVLIPTELWCWVILYTQGDADCAKKLSNSIQKLQDDTGITIGKPLFFEIKSDTKNGYVNALSDIIQKELQLIVVILPESQNKPEKLIKYICCVAKPIPCQIVHSSEVNNPLKVYEITLQLNLMLGGIPWMVQFPYENWMICGIDLRCAFDNKTLPVCSFVTTLTNDASQWYSKAVFVQQNFAKCFKIWLIDTLKKYKGTNGVFPFQVFIYQNCTDENRIQLYNDYVKFNFDECLQELHITNMDICIILVQRDTHLTFFKDINLGNVPPGTIVDNTITNLNARDFFLTSHFFGGTIARPTHYEVIKDTCGLTSEQLQLVTYKMCHLYYKHAKIVEAPAPCLYAEKLGILVTKDIHDIPSANLDECLYYL